MIEVSVSTLIAIKPILLQLANIEMPAKESFKILRTLKCIDKEYELIETTQRKMLDAYGEKDEAGNFIPVEGGLKIKADCSEAFSNEMNDLMNTKINLECEKININLLDKMNLTPIQLMRMEEFIEE